MQLDSRHDGPVQILDASGDILGAEGGKQLTDRIRELLDAGEVLFVLQLTRIARLDSAALGTIVTCRERIRTRDGRVKLVLRGQPRRIFAESGLECLFEIYEDLDEAVDSLFPEDLTAGIP